MVLELSSDERVHQAVLYKVGNRNHIALVENRGGQHIPGIFLSHSGHEELL
jgi:hypothetical protein